MADMQGRATTNKLLDLWFKLRTDEDERIRQICAESEGE